MFGLFGFTGRKTTGMFEGILDMEGGYIKTNEKMETNIPGVYAASVCHKSLFAPLPSFSNFQND